MFLSRNIIETQRRNPSNADRSRLQPAYDRINTAVRQFDEDVLIFFAGVTWDDVGPGFTAPPGGDDFANRSVLAYHYYEPPQADTTAQVDLQRAGARRLGTGLFMTEVWRPLRSFLAVVLTEIYLCDACSCQKKY
jgi:endoglycosylceramidase